MVKQLTEKQQKIKMYYENGKDYKEIAKLVESRSDYVLVVLRNLGYDIPSRYLNQAAKDKIISLHLEGFDTVQIARKMNINDCTVGSILTKAGYTNRRRGRKLSDEQELAVVKEYVEDGETGEVLGLRYGVDPNTIRNIVRRHGHKVRRNGTVSAIKNDNYFAVIDTPTKAYYLGLLITDGCVTKNHQGKPNVIGIMLKESDKHILETLATELGLDVTKVKTTKRNECYLRFHSFQMAEHLSQYGVVNKKTFTAELPTVDEELMSHLIRGVFDGDGGVHVQKRNDEPKTLVVQFYGTQKLCKQLQDYLYSRLKISKNQIIDKQKYGFNVHQFAITSKKNVKAFYDFIYKDIDEDYLKRKYDVFNEHLELLKYKS